MPKSSKKDEYTYDLEKNAKDWKDSQIRKFDSYTFTIRDADRQQDDYRRMEKEWSSQLRVSEAVLNNIERNHPKAAKLPDTEKVAAHMWVENEHKVKQLKQKLREVRDVIKRYDAERVTLLKQFGWEEEHGTGTEKA